MKVREGQPLPAVLGSLYDDPAGQLPAAVEKVARYWHILRVTAPGGPAGSPGPNRLRMRGGM